MFVSTSDTNPEKKKKKNNVCEMIDVAGAMKNYTTPPEIHATRN
jgi:hypothetical protein